mmetsp:Transcript_27744/g.69674  ORF Transcript_27744/g.69674 Transcript_27744/m.69674 type:complete len:206 (-) Transcript_27744:336-953(-)
MSGVEAGAGMFSIAQQWFIRHANHWHCHVHSCYLQPRSTGCGSCGRNRSGGGGGTTTTTIRDAQLLAELPEGTGPRHLLGVLVQSTSWGFEPVAPVCPPSVPLHEASEKGHADDAVQNDAREAHVAMPPHARCHFARLLRHDPHKGRNADQPSVVGEQETSLLRKRVRVDVDESLSHQSRRGLAPRAREQAPSAQPKVWPRRDQR